jgi:hypothetical protein
VRAGEKLVLQCNSGNRTRQAAAQILAREPIDQPDGDPDPGESCA